MRKPAEQAVFITHLHLDHMAHIGTVAPQIPVYMHAMPRSSNALETVGEGVDTLVREYQDLKPMNLYGWARLQ